MGAELEIEFPNGGLREFSKYIHEKKKFAHAESDSSLSNSGVEIVTHYGTIANLLPVLEEICKVAKRNGGKAHDTKTCGMHISLQRSHFGLETIGRLVTFWNREENYSFLRAFARRNYRKHSYARIKLEKGQKEFVEECRLHGIPYSEKYDLVNTCHGSHIEFRAFRGSINPHTVTACVSLVSRLAAYCKHVRSYDSLTAQRFAVWLLKNPRHGRTAAIINYLNRRSQRTDSGKCLTLAEYAEGQTTSDEPNDRSQED